jgi:hypothetical protein
MDTLNTFPSHPVALGETTRQDLVDRGVGASVTAVFGAIWIALGTSVLVGAKTPLLLAIGLVGAALVFAAVRLAPRSGKSCATEPERPERIRRNRQFHIVNGVQWACIVALVLSLNLTHHPEWIADGIVLIVGLHFLPLARLFRSTSHSVAGIALVLWALLYPWVVDGGAFSPWGPIGAGLILWAFSGHLIATLARARGLAQGQR